MQMINNINESYHKWYMEIANQEYKGNLDWLGQPIEEENSDESKNDKSM